MPNRRIDIVMISTKPYYAGSFGENAEDEIVYWVWFAAAFGPANVIKWTAMANFDNPKPLYELLTYNEKWIARAKRLSGYRYVPLENAERIVEYCRRNGINIYSMKDSLYPNRLRMVSNPPAVLFARGDFSGIDTSIVIACVGTRTPSEYSVRVTNRICRELVESGAVVATGTAAGLDTVAARSAIEAGGRAICVYPCGIEYSAYSGKAEAEAFKKLIVENGGAIISEYFPEDRPSFGSYRARNRILSGISLGTLVTQAGVKSGALSTAGLALSESKELFCIPPHELYDDSYSGVIPLIRDGAIPVFDSSDIINVYLNNYTINKSQNTYVRIMKGNPYADDPGNKPEVRKERKKPKKPEKTIQKEQVRAVNTEGMPEEKKKIIDFVSQRGTVLFDEIASNLPDIRDLEAIITELELDGIIKSLSGNRYSL